jgi:hypothetical protein
VPAPLEPEVNARAFAGRGLDDEGLLASLAGRRDDGSAWGPDDLSRAAWPFRPELEVAPRGWATAVAAEVTAGQRPQPGVSVTAGMVIPGGLISSTLLSLVVLPVLALRWLSWGRWGAL